MWTQEKINSVNEPLGELFKITDSSIKRAEDSIVKFLKDNKLIAKNSAGPIDYRNISFKPHKWTCECGKEFIHGNSAFFHIHSAKRPCSAFDYECLIDGKTGFKSLKEILIYLFNTHNYDNKEVKRKSANYLKKKEKMRTSELANFENLTINAGNLSLDQLHEISEPENILYRADEEQLFILEKHVIKFLKRHGLGDISKLRNIPFPKGKSFTCLCGKVYKTGNSVYYHLNNMKNPCGMMKFKCLICGKGGFESRESLFLHLFDSHGYDRNKVRLNDDVERRLSKSPELENDKKSKKSKIKSEVLPESRRRKKVDYSGMGEDVDEDQTPKKGNKRGVLSACKKSRKSGMDEDFDENIEQSDDDDMDVSGDSEAELTTPDDSGSDIASDSDLSNIRSRQSPSFNQSTPKCTFTSLDTLTIQSYSKFYDYWNEKAEKILKPENTTEKNFSINPEFQLKKPTTAERNESSFPFLYFDDDENNYSLVNFGDQIESSNNTFSMFVGLDVIQCITIHDRFIATLAPGHIDFYYEKEPKVSKKSGFSFKFLGRNHNEESETVNFTRIQVPKYGENGENGSTVAIGRSDGKILVLKMNLAEKNVGGEVIAILGDEDYDDDGVFNEIKRESADDTKNEIKMDNSLKSVLEMDFSSSNKYLASSLQNGNINIYSLSDFELICVVHAHEKKCRAVAFCPFNDHLIASGGYDRCLVLHDWYSNPDFPVEHMDVAHSGSVYTSLVWPFSAPAVFAGTENCFAADRLHGVQTYWIGGPQIIDSPTHIFASKDTEK